MSDEPERMADPGLQCYVRHIRAASMCMSGARQWFKMHDWSWPDFLANGRPSGDFVATNDPLALRMVEAAIREANALAVRQTVADAAGESNDG